MAEPDIKLGIGFTDEGGAASTISNIQNRLQGFGAIGQSVLQGVSFAFATTLVQGIQQAAAAVVDFAKESVAAFSEFEDAALSLQSITGVGAEGLELYGDAAKRLAGETKFAASETVKAFELIGSAQPALLKNQEALVGVTEAAITLAEASGQTLPEAATNLTGALNQFGAGADQANRFINTLAAASLEGAAAIPNVTIALKQFGAVAAANNVNIEESAALIEVLAEKSIQGAEAGTALRNVLLRLSAADALPKDAIDRLTAAGVSLDILSDKSIPVADRLQELSKIVDDQTTLVKVFGAENVVAGQIVLGNVDKFRQLTDAVTGTDTAFTQAATRSASLSNTLAKVGNAVNVFMIEFGEQLAPFVSAIGDGIIAAFEALRPIVIGVIETLSEFGQSLGGLIGSFTGASSEGGGFQLIMDGVALSLKAIILPTQLIIQGITFLIDGFVTARDAVDNFLKRLGPIGEALRFLVNPIGATIDAVRALGDAFNDFFGIAEDLPPTLAEGVAALGGNTQAMRAFQESVGATDGDLAKFKDTLDLTKFNGLNLADAIKLLREEYDKFNQSLTEDLGNLEQAPGYYQRLQTALKELNGEFEAAQTIAEKAEIGKEIRELSAEIEQIDKLRRKVAEGEIAPKAGSLKALNAELTKLRERFETATTAAQQFNIIKQIEATEDKIKGVNTELLKFYREQRPIVPVDIAIRVPDLEPTTAAINAAAARLPDQVFEKKLSLADLKERLADFNAQFEQTVSDIERREIAGKIIDLEGQIADIEKLRQAMTFLKDTVSEVKNALVQGFGEIAFSIGEAIAGATTAMDVFRQVIDLLLVQVPKMVGFALINQAAAVPSPASLPLALAGLALIGLSGLVSGLLNKGNDDVQDALKSAQSSASSAGAAGPVGGLSQFSAGDTRNEINVQVNLDGQSIENAFVNVFENGQEVRARR